MNELMLQSGQRLMTGFSGTTPPKELIQTVKKYKIGNYILFAENIASARQLRQLCAALRDMAISETGMEPLISTDQEGGRVQRLPKDIINTPSAREIAAANSIENAYSIARHIAETLRELGLNYDLAPVMDIDGNNGSTVIGDRSFGTDAETVSRFGTAMIRGMRDGGVLTCAKHFPGHGGTGVDTHLSLPIIDTGMDELAATALVPFERAIEAGVGSIMTTHIVFSRLDKSYPATLSRAVIDELLRKGLSYSGMIITDCLQMGAIASHYGVSEAALLSMKAGVDMFTISHDCAAAGRAALLISQALERGETSMAEHETALNRIAEAKRWLNTL